MHDLSRQIKFKKKIGSLNGSPIFGISYIGGLNVIAISKGGKVETLGMGPSIGLAKMQARRANENVEFTELSKSEVDEERYFTPELIKEYEELRTQFNDALKLISPKV